VNQPVLSDFPYYLINFIYIVLCISHDLCK
jgi:hypothetical protein